MRIEHGRVMEGSGDVAGGTTAGAILGGILFAGGFLSLAFLFGALLSPDSVLGRPGSGLFGAFVWAAWFIPPWFFVAALLVILPGFQLHRAFTLGASALPFLFLAAFARVLDRGNPLIQGLGEGFSRSGLALVFGLLFAASCALVAWLTFLLTPAALLGDTRGEAGKPARPVRPGLFSSEDEAAQADEAEAPLAAGRRVESDSPVGGLEGFEPGLPDLSEAAPGQTAIPAESAEAASGADGQVAAAPAAPPKESAAPAFEFRVPVIPAPPRLRSLGEGPEASASGASASEAAAPEAAVPDAVASEMMPEPKAAEQAEETATEKAEEAIDPEDVPIPLFFREAAPGSGAPLILRKSDAAETAATVASGSGAAGSEDTKPTPAVESLSLDGLSKPIEFTSVPPAPASHEAEELAKASVVARILARKKRPPYAVPVDGLLMQYPDGQYWIIDDKTRKSAEVLRDTLMEFNIEAEVTGIRKGPVITMFEILPAPGVRLSKIANLCDNIALRLAASSVRIVAPIPGKHAVGIEVPNERRSIVSLREIVESESFVTAKAEVPVALGKDIAGEVQFIDLVQTPHLLIAGSTGSGKSVCVNSIILSILFRRSPEDVRLLLIDPKIVELKLYNGVPHLLTPVITEPKRAFQALQYCICEMERRYAMLDRVGVRDIKSYNRKIKEKGLAQDKLPYIVVIIDEFADLMATTGKELESTLARLAAMSRAVGIHLVLATQRPSIDVITGLIKANIPSRIAFMVASKFDSRIIIDMVGAEKLLGRGDMLFASAWDPFPIRMQGAFVSEEEVEKAVDFIKTLGEPDYIDEDIFIDDDEEEAEPSLFDDGDGDPLFEQALEIVLQQGRASASFIQRKLKIGYNRAARIVELMEEKGIVGKAQGSKPRDLVRNPEITGLRASAEVGAGATRMSLRERGEGLDPDAGGKLPVAGTRESSLPPLVASLETVPGQRVTGRDEED